MAYIKVLDAELLQAALGGYERQRAVIEERIAEIRRELGGGAGRQGAVGSPKPKRVVSAAVRRRMAASQRKRWAQAKKDAGGPDPKTQRPKTRRKMSAEARERIAEATRKRWAAYRAAKATS